jgi:predicted hydrocarbon binding protein
MDRKFDFEHAWLGKFSNSLSEIAGEDIRKEVMRGSEGLSAQSIRQDIIDWSKVAMERLDSLVDVKKRREIMTGCACQYSKSELQGIKEKFQVTKDTELAHKMLQEQFESFLENSLKLRDELIEIIVDRGWGSAGIKEGRTVIATKIPKSGDIIEYMNETDPVKKRWYYCHCPRVRDILKTSDTISQTYCYCGAGFYKGIWEEILQRTVEVEVLESVLTGDEVCKIGIYLPPDLS